MPTIAETHRKISGFGNAAPGWHFGDGIPASNESVAFSHSINNALRDAGFPSTDAFLGVGGQIQVNGYWGNRYLELIVEDGRVYFRLENDRQLEFEEKNLDILNTISRIRFWGALWATSGFSIQTILTIHSGVSRRYQLQSPSMAEFPSSIAVASRNLEEASVNISSIIMGNSLKSLANPQYILKSLPSVYRCDAAS